MLDIDLTGPSVPRLLGIESSNVHSASDGWVPVMSHHFFRRFHVDSLVQMKLKISKSCQLLFY